MPLSRWSSRHKKTFGKKKKEKWDGNFRLPPKPDSYYVETKGSVFLAIGGIFCITRIDELSILIIYSLCQIIIQ